MNEKERRLHELLGEETNRYTKVQETTDGGLIVSLALWDSMGDPVTVTVYYGTQGTWEKMDDAGSVAGYLFSAMQDTEESPGYQLAMALSKSHRVQPDYEEGTLVLRNNGESLHHAVMTMAKMILTINTALPHLKTICGKE